MNERINFQDSKVLIICPSRNWSSIERRAYKDALLLRDMGSHVEVFCIEESKLHNKLKNSLIDCIVYKGRSTVKSYDYKFYKELKNILLITHYNLVHCFRLDYIWTICLVMGAFKKIPLFLTVNKDFTQTYKSFLRKFILRRVDRVFSLNQAHTQIIPVFLPVHKRKVKFAGMGVELAIKNNFNHLSFEDKSKLVTIVDDRAMEQLDILIQVVLQLASKKNIELIIYTDLNTDEKEKVKLIKNKIISNGAGRFIGVRKFESVSLAFSPGHIFVSLFSDEVFCDYEIDAMSRGLFVVAPRSVARGKLKSWFYQNLRTYKRNDTSSLYRNLKELVVNHNNLLKSLESQSEEMYFYHGVDHYVDLLVKNYLASCRARLRIASK
ncbi:MAG: hypothetical protein N4A33_12565 [Bacteriovoracaceae bacterium]|jgi:hypothetical protein|nr:hypothetical protein [Bacteriovoracaceae bacterium]